MSEAPLHTPSSEPAALVRASGLAALLALGFELAGGLGFPSTLWGAHAWAFLPRPAFAGASLVLLALSAILVFRSGWAVGACVRWPLVLERSPRFRVWLPIALAVVAGVVFWAARCAHLLLGDGLPLVSQVTAGGGFHPHEPLAGLLQRLMADLAAGAFDAPGREPYEAIWDALALGSVLAGCGFVVLLVLLARELTPGIAGWAWWPLVLAQGALQLFFGYVENYAWAALAALTFLVAGVRYLHGRMPGWGVSLCFVAGILCHYSLLALAPALVVLVRERGPRSERRWPPRPGPLILALVVLAGVTAWALVRPGTDPIAVVSGLARTLVAELAGGGARSLFTLAHARDVLNLQLLVGPVGGVLFAVVIAMALAGRLRVTAPERFLLAAAGGAAVLAWIASPSNLGYARNWDLLAPSGFVMTIAAVAVIARVLPGPRGVTLAGVLVAVSLFHTVPWIAVNASEPRALARFETLPLGGGRVESTLGYWHVLRGRATEGERWLLKAARVAPWNARAHILLGRLRARQGRYREAAIDYERARALRPDDRDVTLRAIDALVRSEQLAAAAAVVEAARRRDPADPVLARISDWLRAARDPAARGSRAEWAEVAGVHE